MKERCKLRRMSEQNGNKIGPCPIPNCASEWILAILTLLASAALMLLPTGLQLQDWLDHIKSSVGWDLRAFPQVWGVFLASAGAFQIASQGVNRFSQRWGAAAGFVAWGITSVLMIKASLGIIAFVGIGIALSELYVVIMLW